MATTEKEYTNGTGNTYSFDFPYMNAVDVKVEKNGSDLALITTGTPTETEYTLATTEVTLGGTIVTSDKIRIYRSTSDSSLIATFYPGSAIRSGDLNDNFTQNLYSTQENTNNANDALDNSQEWDSSTNDYKSAFSKAADAVNTADGADDKADDALLATDSLVGTTTDNGVTWTLKGDGQSPNPKGVEFVVNQVDTYVHDGTNPQGDGIGGNPQGLKYAIDTADEAKDTYAIPAKNATDALVGVYDAGTSTWTTKGHANAGAGDPESGVGKALDDAADAVSTADTAKDTYAIPAKQATDALVGTTSDGGTTWTVVGGGPADSQPKGVKYAIDQVETYVHDGTGPQGDGQGSNPKGVAYAIDQVETYVHDGTSVMGDGLGSNPKGVAYAITTAEEASASVAASAIYKVVADLSTLETDYPLTGNQPSPPGPDPSNLAPTPDGTFVQITDSTGISYDGTNWTTGFDGGAYSFPNGFSGHSQLTLRVKVSNASAGSETYIVQEYYANDPEARYGEVRKILVENERTISESETIQTTMNAHSVGPVTLSHNGTDLTYNATTYVTSNSATAGYTITIPENSTWLIS